jgi:hypothetical protein
MSEQIDKEIQMTPKDADKKKGERKSNSMFKLQEKDSKGRNSYTQMIETSSDKKRR